MVALNSPRFCRSVSTFERSVATDCCAVVAAPSAWARSWFIVSCVWIRRSWVATTWPCNSVIWPCNVVIWPCNLAMPSFARVIAACASCWAASTCAGRSALLSWRAATRPRSAFVAFDTFTASAVCVAWSSSWDTRYSVAPPMARTATSDAPRSTRAHRGSRVEPVPGSSSISICSPAAWPFAEPPVPSLAPRSAPCFRSWSATSVIPSSSERRTLAGGVVRRASGGASSREGRLEAVAENFFDGQPVSPERPWNQHGDGGGLPQRSANESPG